MAPPSLTQEGSAPASEASRAASEMPLSSTERRDSPRAGTGRRAALALGFTAALVAFVGTLVVLTIPFVVISIPLPPGVNRLGLSVESTQALFFGRPWYLLVPALLIGVWIGYRSYRWSCSTIQSHRST